MAHLAVAERSSRYRRETATLKASQNGPVRRARCFYAAQHRARLRDREAVLLSELCALQDARQYDRIMQHCLRICAFP